MCKKRIVSGDDLAKIDIAQPWPDGLVSIQNDTTWLHHAGKLFTGLFSVGEFVEPAEMKHGIKEVRWKRQIGSVGDRIVKPAFKMHLLVVFGHSFDASMHHTGRQILQKQLSVST